jgi:hypothetical protein
MTEKRKLYDKISISGDVLYALDVLKQQISAQDPSHKKVSYNTAIKHLLNQQSAD